MAINTKSGTDATVKISTTTVLAIKDWDFTDKRDALKAPVFGDSTNKVHGMGSRDISGSMTGYFSEGDSTGQEIFKTAYRAGTTVSGLRLHIDSSIYYYASGTDDIDGFFLTSCNIGAAQNAIVPIVFNFEVGGDWEETTI